MTKVQIALPAKYKELLKDVQNFMPKIDKALKKRDQLKNKLKFSIIDQNKVLSPKTLKALKSAIRIENIGAKADDIYLKNQDAAKIQYYVGFKTTPLRPAELERFRFTFNQRTKKLSYTDASKTTAFNITNSKFNFLPKEFKAKDNIVAVTVETSYGKVEKIKLSNKSRKQLTINNISAYYGEDVLINILADNKKVIIPPLATVTLSGTIRRGNTSYADKSRLGSMMSNSMNNARNDYINKYGEGNLISFPKEYFIPLTRKNQSLQFGVSVNYMTDAATKNKTLLSLKNYRVRDLYPEKYLTAKR